MTGATTDLVYVSPRSGRAVSRAGAGDYADRLLASARLPAWPGLGPGRGRPAQITAGLRLTGAFLRRHLFDASERPLPAARERLIRRLADATAGSPSA